MNGNEMLKLDGFCAEFVMQWKVVAHARPDMPECLIYNTGEVYTVHKMSSGGNQLVPFSPTTNDADALKVLEKCAGKCGVEIFDSSVSVVKCYTVRSDQLGGPSAQAETLPLAISKFAKLLYSEKG